MVSFDFVTRFIALLGLLLSAHVPLSAQQNGNPLLAHIVPLESCLPKDTLSAKEREALSALFSGARVVGLGEATHGTHEIFTMKHRLMKFLIESKGFKLIGLEAGMPEVEVVNRYILSGEGSSSALLAVRQLGMWSVGNYEMLDLVQWLYHFNQQQTEKNKVRICGFDVQMTDSAVRTVTRFLGRVNPQYAATLLNTENCYQWLTANSTMTAQNIWTYQADSIKQQYISNADSVLYHFERYRKHYERATSPKEFAWAQRNAWLVSRAVRLFSSTKTRDSSMAENVSWLMKYFKHDKIILSAHNGHVWCENHTASNSDATMGWYLREKYAQEYFAVATTANIGTYSAVRDGTLQRNNELMLPSHSNLLESYLHLSAVPQGFINFRTIKDNDYFYSWFTARQGIRFIGSKVLPTQFGYAYLLKNFDALVFIDTTTASSPLPNVYQMR